MLTMWLPQISTIRPLGLKWNMSTLAAMQVGFHGMTAKPVTGSQLAPSGPLHGMPITRSTFVTLPLVRGDAPQPAAPFAAVQANQHGLARDERGGHVGRRNGFREFYFGCLDLVQIDQALRGQQLDTFCITR